MPSPVPVAQRAAVRRGSPHAPGEPPPAAPSSLPAAARLAAAAVALALALVPIVRQRALAARQVQMTAWLAGSGVPPPREIEHEPDPSRVDLRAARASLAAELDPARRSDLPPAEEARQRAEGSARLATTARLAGGALAERPAAWEAAMVMGAATYLSWSQARDLRLFTAAPAWERPLETAIALAPGRDEAARLLAGAYLELWPVLSPAKRDRERRLLASVFSNPPAFASLIGPWLATAATREEAFAPVPRTPEAWAKLQQIYALQADWQGYCEARERWDLALQASLTSRLAAAEAVAARELARLAARQWPATAWYFHDGLPRLELLAAAGAAGLELMIDEAPPRGAAAEVRLDESILGTFPVTAGKVVSLRTPIAPGLHLLEIESVAGGAVLPGTVRLVRADAGGSGGGTAVGGGGGGGEPR